MGSEYQKFNKVLNNSWGKLVKATWSRDLTMALGLSRLERGRGESVGSVFLAWGLLPLINRSTDGPSYSVC